MMGPVVGYAQERLAEPVGNTISLPYQHIVVLGDPHLPGRNLAAKEQVIRTVNNWTDVDCVVALGDLCADVGTAVEIEHARRYFRKLRKPLSVIHGNHDYVYCDERDPSGNRVKGSPATRAYKLKRFMETFAMKTSYYSRRVGGYLLIFLSADDLHADSVTWMSAEQLDWWQAEMQAYKGLPTIIFSHAPLQGTVSVVREGTAAVAAGLGALLLGGPEWALPAAFVGDSLVRRIEGRQMAQPQDRIRQIVKENPQLFLWVSGHFHVTGVNRTFNSIDNVYRKQVTLVHNSDMDGWGFHAPWRSWRHDTIWTNSLYLYPDRVEIKTYDHTAGVWLNKMDRIVSIV